MVVRLPYTVTVMDESAFPLTAGVRVRASRVGFLVNPGDRDAVRQVMTVNTSLWGGSFNPMIPVLSRRPRWDVGPLPPPSAKQITRGYLSCWQPDLLVSAVPGAGDRYDAVIDLGDWLSESAEHRSPLGVDAVAVFEAVHRRERRFLLREPRDIVLPVAEDERFADLIACCLGRLPDGDATERFVRQLAAERVPVGADNLLTAFVVTASRTPMWGPLGVGGMGLTSESKPQRGLTVLVMRGRSSHDLVAFWNLRAAGFPVVPFPLEWAEDLLPALRDLSDALAGNEDPWRDRVEVVRSPWLPERQGDSAWAMIEGAGVRAMQSQYPSFWHRSGRRDVGLVADEDSTVQAPWVRGHVELPLGAPSFLGDVRDISSSHWANVVELRPSILHSEIATVFPATLGRVGRLLNAVTARDVTAADEGLVVRVNHRREHLTFQPPNGTDVWVAYLAALGLKARLSPPGRTALEIIRRVGGLGSLRLIADWGLLQEIVRAADVEPDRTDPERADDRPSRVNPRRYIDHARLREALSRLHEADGDRAERHLQRLTEQEVLRAGLIVECPNCEHSNWFEPSDLTDDLRCELCLSEFSFPHHRPPRDWAYRARGGFRLQGWGDGSYSVVLALHRLLSGTHEPSAWTPNLDVSDIGEVDFAVLVKQRGWTENEDATILIGECKSQGRFAEADRDRALRVRARLPDAILVFASFNEELTTEEKHLLIALARPPVDSFENLPHQPDLMVLTRTELFARDGLREAWRRAGGKIAALAPKGHGQRPPLSVLCDVTQRMHLGLGPFSEWHQSHIERLLGASSSGPRSPESTLG